MHRINTLVILIAMLIVGCSSGSETDVPSTPEPSPPETAEPITSLSPSGYTLFAPNNSNTTFLIDADGMVVNRWDTDLQVGKSVYLLENGNLLHTASVESEFFDAGGAGGRVEEYDWDGKLVWKFNYANKKVFHHHDIARIPNGNILLIAWESKTQAEAISAGRSPDLIPEEKRQTLWPDHIIEVDPSTNEVVWQWHVWDHLIQDVDSTKANFGVIRDHPERIDINYVPTGVESDWNHINAIDYNADLDQIMLSVHHNSEIWIIDHATTTEESRGPAGDLLYRWGNPEAYDTRGKRQLFRQHNAQWIAEGLPGAGNILIFNNGERKTYEVSRIFEIVPPLDETGSYIMTPGAATNPDAPVWMYIAARPKSFYARNVSAAQRLPNANTLITDGPAGRFFEVTPEGETVWEYIIPSEEEGKSVMVFRGVRYQADFAGLLGRMLTPMGPVEPQPVPPPRGGGDNPTPTAAP